MSKSVEELWGLLQQAQQLPYGAAQIALVEQVLRHADAAGDRQLAFAARMLATNAYTYGGEVAKSFVTFSWCLSDFDRDPAPFHARFKHNLFWHFKYMVSALTKFPEVPLERTRAVLDDMERRYREDGHSPQPVYKYRYVVARHVGATDEADEWYRKWITASRDSLSDCLGCDPTDQVAYLAEQGRDEEAVALAEPVLAGRATCVEQPQSILTELLLPYLRSGRDAEAVDAHRRAYRLIRGNLADLWGIGEHLAFCVRTGNEARGLEILQRHLDWLDRAPSPAAGMAFAASAVAVLRRLAATGHGDLPLHRQANGDRPAGQIPVAALAEELTRYVTALAARFDARNGTNRQSRLMEQRMAVEPAGAPLLLSASARRSPAVAPELAPGIPAPVAAPTGVPAAPAGKIPTAPAAEIPADADPAVLLDLAEAYERADADAACTAVLAAVDERFGADLPAALAGRRAELRGHLSWADGDPAAAAGHYERAAQLFAEAGDPARASIASGCLGLVRAFTGDAEQGRALVEADLGYQEQHGGPRERAAAHGRLTGVLMAQGRLDEALAALDRADRLTAELGDPRLVARNAARRAMLLVNQDRRDEAAAAAEAATAFYREQGPVEPFVKTALLYAQCVPDQDVALAVAGEVVAVARDDDAVNARLARARALMALDRPADAVDDFVEAVAFCTERGIEDGAAAIRHELAIAYRDADRLFEAAEVAEEAVTAWDRLGAQQPADDSRFVLAGIYGRLGDAEAALALYDDLAARLATDGNHAGRAQVVEQAADVLYRADRDAEAADRFAAAVDEYRACGDQAGEVRALRRRLAALHWADDVPAAEAVIASAWRRHDDLPPELTGQPPMVWERGVLAFEVGRFLAARGRHAEALPYLDGVPDRLRAIGAVQEAGQVAGLLAEVLDELGRGTDAARLRSAYEGTDQDS